MRLFRCFVLTMTGTLFWFFSEKSFLKIIIAVLIVFLLAYYGKEIDIITQNKKIFFVVTIFLALISAFFVFRLHNTKYENELHDSKVDLRMVVVRPSVVSGEHNITLGRIVNEGSFRDKYILIRSDLFESYEINQILFANAKIQRHKNKSVPFDLLFFGKVFYQIGFEKIEVVGKNKQFNIFEKMAT